MSTTCQYLTYEKCQPFIPFYLIASLPCLLAAVLLSNCSYKTYYSKVPSTGTPEKHQTIPLQSDSVKSGLYASVALLWAQPMTERDTTISTPFTWSVSRSHNLGIFQAYYGGGVTWAIMPWADGTAIPGNTLRAAPGVNGRVLDSAAGNKFFGGYGISGGIDLVMPLAQ